MTTLENAMMLFATLFSGGMMSAVAWGVKLRRHRAVTAQQIAAERLHAVQQKALAEQRKLRSVKSAIASDYCAGADHLVLRGSMHWTVDGEWRCKECAPIDESAELAAEIEAAAEALDDGGEVRAAGLIPSHHERARPSLPDDHRSEDGAAQAGRGHDPRRAHDLRRRVRSDAVSRP